MRWGGLRTWRQGRAWASNGVLCLLGVGLFLLARQFVSERDHFTMGLSGVSGWSVVLYIASILVILTQPTNRYTLRIVLGFALAFQIVTLFADPFTSTDIYRYVWDGIVQHAHINPYRYVPGNPALTFLRAPNQDIFDNINRRDYARTIYPPAAQMVYWLATFISPTVTAMKAVMIGFECLAIWAMLRILDLLGRARTDILFFAWCPLLVWEIGGAGHVDGAVIGLIAVALLCRLRNKPTLTGLFLGLAVMTKFYPLVLFPALHTRRDWKMPAALTSVCVAGYAIYSSVGRDVFGFLFGYTKEEGMDSGARYFLLDLVRRVHVLSRVPTDVYYVFCAGVLGAICWWAWTHASTEVIIPSAAPQSPPAFLWASAALAFAMMLLFSPHYGWYLAWLVPFLVLTPNLPMPTYVLLFFYLFNTRLGTPGPPMFLLNKIMYSLVVLSFVVAYLLRRDGAERLFLCTAAESERWSRLD